jgi:hypothetical protein
VVSDRSGDRTSGYESTELLSPVESHRKSYHIDTRLVNYLPMKGHTSEVWCRYISSSTDIRGLRRVRSAVSHESKRRALLCQRESEIPCFETHSFRKHPAYLTPTKRFPSSIKYTHQPFKYLTAAVQLSVLLIVLPLEPRLLTLHCMQFYEYYNLPMQTFESSC